MFHCITTKMNNKFLIVLALLVISAFSIIIRMNIAHRIRDSLNNIIEQWPGSVEQQPLATYGLPWFNTIFEAANINNSYVIQGIVACRQREEQIIKNLQHDEVALRLMLNAEYDKIDNKKNGILVIDESFKIHYRDFPLYTYDDQPIYSPIEDIYGNIVILNKETNEWFVLNDYAKYAVKYLGKRVPNFPICADLVVIDHEFVETQNFMKKSEGQPWNEQYKFMFSTVVGLAERNIVFDVYNFSTHFQPISGVPAWGKVSNNVWSHALGGNNEDWVNLMPHFLIPNQYFQIMKEDPVTLNPWWHYWRSACNGLDFSFANPLNQSKLFATATKTSKVTYKTNDRKRKRDVFKFLDNETNSSITTSLQPPQKRMRLLPNNISKNTFNN
eukprot:512825_1